jgi:hypothetical protein
MDCRVIPDQVGHRRPAMTVGLTHAAPSMKEQQRQNRDLQSEGEAHHPFQDNEFGIDP